ncbi:MAG: hypothetical protein NTW30_04975, partial [Candidatus Aenigmarchaeota archaeon]|nr:hypothetical protein [Candidatus Aenigmarchaeota archaeon]
MDSFKQNIEGVRQLIESGINKGRRGDFTEEGVSGDFEDVFTLKMTDEELLDLKRQWENKSAPYTEKIKSKQITNKHYYLGTQRQNVTATESMTVSSNIIFEAEETFIPQALSKNPEPVVWSDNTDEGKNASNEIKTMLQFHSDILCLRKKLGVMLRHWSIYYLGIVKHGWDTKSNDISTEIRKPKNFILDPDGYIDEYGNYVGNFLGEKIECTAERLITLFPKQRNYILIKSDGKLGTQLTRTEWWTDEYCFTTLGDIVLDKHRNEYFNYDKEETQTDEYGIETPNTVKGNNHFATPKMPYTFLSIFSLQEQPHDVTNLIEQNIANQNRINDRDEQIDKNLRHGNNSIAVSGKS